MSDSGRNDNNTLRSWLGFQEEWQYQNAPRLGTFLGFALTAFAILVGMAIFAIFGLILVSLFESASKIHDHPVTAISTFSALLLGIFGVPFLAWRSITAHRQANTAEQGLITDRISKAVNQIGADKTVQRHSHNKANTPLFHDRKKGRGIDLKKPIMETVTLPNLEVRIGGLYALERIAKDSLGDHIQIMEILCAYVRENAPVESLEPTKGDFQIAKPRADIQAVIDILGRRSLEQIDKECSQKFRLDLRGSDLSGVNFSNGNFSAAKLHHCRLEAARFSNAILHGTWLHSSLLNHIDFFQADMVGARLNHVLLNLPKPINGGMNFNLIGAKTLRGASFIGADLRAVDYLGEPRETNLTFGTLDTMLDDNIDFSPEKLKELRTKRRLAKRKGNSLEFEQVENEIDTLGFRYWSPYNSSDGATNFHYTDFLKAMGLQGFPYE